MDIPVCSHKERLVFQSHHFSGAFALVLASAVTERSVWIKTMLDYCSFHDEKVLVDFADFSDA